MDKIELIKKWFDEDFKSSYKNEFKLTCTEDDNIVVQWWNGKKGESSKVGAICLLLDSIDTENHLKIRWNNMIDTFKNAWRSENA